MVGLYLLLLDNINILFLFFSIINDSLFFLFGFIFLSVLIDFFIVIVFCIKKFLIRVLVINCKFLGGLFMFFIVIEKFLEILKNKDDFYY